MSDCASKCRGISEKATAHLPCRGTRTASGRRPARAVPASEVVRLLVVVLVAVILEFRNRFVDFVLCSFVHPQSLIEISEKLSLNISNQNCISVPYRCTGSTTVFRATDGRAHGNHVLLSRVATRAHGVPDPPITGSDSAVVVRRVETDGSGPENLPVGLSIRFIPDVWGWKPPWSTLIINHRTSTGPVTH